VPCTKLYEAWSHARQSDVIGIDEAQVSFAAVLGLLYCCIRSLLTHVIGIDDAHFYFDMTQCCDEIGLF
jgi:DNA-directed RNA polymerase subunit N (RpoN/RPB10)